MRWQSQHISRFLEVGVVGHQLSFFLAVSSLRSFSKHPLVGAGGGIIRAGADRLQ